MPREYSRWCEHLSLSGGYLYGAIVGFALSVASLVPLIFVLYYLIFFAMFYPAPASVVAALRCAGRAQCRYLGNWRIPGSAILGHCLFLGGLAFGLPFVARAFDSAGSPENLDTWVSLTYMGVMCHVSILWGGAVASEFIYRKPQHSGSACGYPAWGYLTGGLVGTVFSMVVFRIAADSGLVGIGGAALANLVVIGLAVLLIDRIAAGFGRTLTPPRPAAALAKRHGRSRDNLPVLLVLLVAAILAVLFMGIRMRQ